MYIDLPTIEMIDWYEYQIEGLDKAEDDMDIIKDNFLFHFSDELKYLSYEEMIDIFEKCESH